MPYSLKGRNVLVTGGSRGLGALICHLFAKEGCNVAVNYFSSEDSAKGVAEKAEKEFGVKTCLIQGNMGVEADCIRTVKETIAQLGGLDIIISNAGHTRFSKFSDLNAPTVEDWDTCFAVNVKAQTFLMREALPTFNANPEGGVFIITSSIAGICTSGSSMPYTVTKAAQLHLMLCMAATQGPKIRVNAIMPGWLDTEWGNKYSQGRINEVIAKSWLKKGTDLEDCAQTFIDVARNTSMTGQKISVDSGLGQA
ncbi:Short-chain dehydrogenase protein sdr [Venustampulla echinocandica]|uniref:Short-chain dehydrogenase protein sdr n=1 Tax=Venustampulla echinocandica TaxID=2656787 RepID=A0A370TQY0_9HELO|nr:Short-chain dehydrogenase protein sdr [Venustampulla echinocandica]RDL37933.1 Short-chain dehydrogenase protein sdr [Venustampulla echinocandica]